MGCEDCKIEPDGNDPTCQSCKGDTVKVKHTKKEKVVVAPELEPKRPHKKK